jgi:hypothetical protein
MENITPYNSSGIKASWKNFLRNSSNRNLTVSTILALLVTLFLLSSFLTYNETRTGTVIYDPVLAMFDPINLTWSTFALIYSGLLIGIFHFVQNPPVLVRALLTYSFLALIRICMMYSIPLDPPAEMISLTDPFVELFGSGSTLDRDLFFSGHTSTMFMLFLLAYKPLYKKMFLAGVILVGASVILQHAHYTIDVLVAPFVAYASYRIAGMIADRKVKS